MVSNVWATYPRFLPVTVPGDPVQKEAAVLGSEMAKNRMCLTLVPRFRGRTLMVQGLKANISI